MSMENEIISETISAWLARDSVNFLNYYLFKPEKDEEEGMWVGNDGDGNFGCIPEYLFPNIQWEDEEPTEIELTIKLKNKYAKDKCNNIM